MKFFLIFFLILYSSISLSGAPAVDDSPIPTPPYLINNAKHLSIGVEWDINTIKQYMPDGYIINSNIKINGGINIFSSRGKFPLSPLTGSFAWVDLQDINSSSNKSHRWVLFGIFGPNKDIIKIMTNVYNLDLKTGANKVTLINQSASARANIKNKNVISLKASVLEDCKAASGSYELISQSKQGKYIKNQVPWKSNKMCNAKPTSVVFSGEYSNVKIVNMLWAKTFENNVFSYNLPIINNQENANLNP